MACETCRSRVAVLPPKQPTWSGMSWKLSSSSCLNWHNKCVLFRSSIVLFLSLLWWSLSLSLGESKVTLWTSCQFKFSSVAGRHKLLFHYSFWQNESIISLNHNCNLQLFPLNGLKLISRDFCKTSREIYENYVVASLLSGMVVIFFSGITCTKEYISSFIQI